MARQQQGQESTGMEGLYYSAFLVILAAGSWHFYHAEITKAAFGMSYYQAYAMLLPLQLLDSVMDIIAPLLGIQPPTNPWVTGDYLIEAINLINQVSYSNATVSDVFYVLSIVGLYFAAFTTPIWLALSMFLIYADIGGRYKNTYSFETLRTKESENWPYITTVVGKNLVNTGLDEGPFAMSQQPMEFAKLNKILDIENVNGRQVATVNRVRAYQVFSLQMGPSWNGNLQGFPPHVLALFAAFASKAEHDTDSCNKLLRQIAASSGGENPALNFTGTYGLLEKHLKSMRIAKAVGPHAFLLPAMASLLELAREDGVLAAAEFLWLKTVDRPLWYMLNSVGRRTAFPEVAGPFGHWVVEKRLRRPLQTAMVEEAINGLEEAISEVIYKPDDE